MWIFIGQHKHLASLLFCILFSTSLLFWHGQSLNSAFAYFGYFTSRFGILIESWSSSFDLYWLSLERYQKLEKAYAQTRRQLDQSRLEKDRFEVLMRENAQLRELLAYSSTSEIPEISAEVLSVRNDAISPRLIISKGETSGIRPFMPVLTGATEKNGNYIRTVLGLVVAVFQESSLVQPITHPDFQLGVRIVDTGAWALLSGNSGNPNELRLKYIVSSSHATSVLIPQENEQEIQPDSKVVTSGNAGIYPRGIPVGRVDRIGSKSEGFQTAIVRPYAAVHTLDHVSVLLKEREPWIRAQKTEQELLDFPQSEIGPIAYDEQTIRNPNPPAGASKKKASVKTKASEKKEQASGRNGSTGATSRVLSDEKGNTKEGRDDILERRTLRTGN